VTVSQGDTPVLTRLRDQLDAGAGPALAGEFPAALLHLLGATYRERLKGLSEHAERLQERIYDSQSRDVQSRLSLLRRHAGRLGGLLDDSRCLTDELLAQELSWLEGKPHKGIRAQRDHLHRLLGEMRDLREHLHSLQDELNGLLDHRLNQRVYLLTVISGVCFPLVFITGLLGVNVGGIPGANSPYAFWFLCLILAVLGLSGGWLLRRRHWF
jgi:zinc transporter